MPGGKEALARLAKGYQEINDLNREQGANQAKQIVKWRNQEYHLEDEPNNPQNEQRGMIARWWSGKSQSDSDRIKADVASILEISCNNQSEAVSLAEKIVNSAAQKVLKNNSDFSEIKKVSPETYNRVFEDLMIEINQPYHSKIYNEALQHLKTIEELKATEMSPQKEEISEKEDSESAASKRRQANDDVFDPIPPTLDDDTGQAAVAKQGPAKQGPAKQGPADLRRNLASAIRNLNADLKGSSDSAWLSADVGRILNLIQDVVDKPSDPSATNTKDKLNKLIPQMRHKLNRKINSNGASSDKGKCERLLGYIDIGEKVLHNATGSEQTKRQRKLEDEVRKFRKLASQEKDLHRNTKHHILVQCLADVRFAIDNPSGKDQRNIIDELPVMLHKQRTHFNQMQRHPQATSEDRAHAKTALHALDLAETVLENATGITGRVSHQKGAARTRTQKELVNGMLSKAESLIESIDKFAQGESLINEVQRRDLKTTFKAHIDRTRKEIGSLHSQTTQTGLQEELYAAFRKLGKYENYLKLSASQLQQYRRERKLAADLGQKVDRLMKDFQNYSRKPLHIDRADRLDQARYLIEKTNDLSSMFQDELDNNNAASARLRELESSPLYQSYTAANPKLKNLKRKLRRQIKSLTKELQNDPAVVKKGPIQIRESVTDPVATADFRSIPVVQAAMPDSAKRRAQKD